jgi:hypothetical protein
MDGIRAFAIGWDLDHPQIQSSSFADAPKLNRADVVFLATSAMEEFWQHAVGEQLPMFRSPAREHAAWDDLLGRIGELKQMIKRGGLLVCRLDRPRRRCAVRCPPSRGGFPKVAEIDAYAALGGAHKGLKLLADQRIAVEPADLEPGTPMHPFAAYVGHFFWELAPRLAVAKAPGDAVVLAQAASGEPVALAWPGCVALPRLALDEPRREAWALLRGAAETLKKPWPEELLQGEGSHLHRSFPLPGLDQLVSRENQLERQIADLRRQRLEVSRLRCDLESLWGLVQPTGHEQLKRAVVVALELLGFLVRGAESGESDSLVIHSPELDAAGTVLLAGKRQEKPDGSTTLRWPKRALGPATKFYLFVGSEDPHADPLEVPLAGEVIRNGGCIVPTAELLEAVRTSLGKPGLSKHTLRLALAERTGLYQLAEPQ